MKIFWRVFTIAFILFSVLIYIVIWTFNTNMREDIEGYEAVNVTSKGKDSLDKDEITDDLRILISRSERVNFIILGTEGPRSDMILFLSYDYKNRQLDGISIPRDTYLVREGYPNADQKKINAAYGPHGATGMKSIISELIYEIPIDYYITLSYQGVQEIVDSIGGVPMYIPELMEYNDPNADPPLRIYFTEGEILLDGEDSVKFLRYRKANRGSGAMNRNGDIGRIEAQQEFIRSALKKTIGLRLPFAINTAFKYVETDMELQEAVKLGVNAMGLNMEDIKMHMLPGEAADQNGISYFFSDGESLKKLLATIYANVDEEGR